jgi:hypothetical protein
MTVIRYPRHFALVAAAAVIVVLLPRLPLPVWVNGFAFFFAATGLLYAGTLILALNAPVSLPKRLAFAGISALLSGGAPFVGLSLGSLLKFGDSVALPAAFAIASAAGAAAYFFLVRALLIPGLAARWGWRMPAMCAAGTVLLYATAVVGSSYGIYRSVLDALPTIGWWLSFSLSLYLAERAGAAARRPQVLSR